MRKGAKTYGHFSREAFHRILARSLCFDVITSHIYAIELLFLKCYFAVLEVRSSEPHAITFHLSFQ